MQNIVGNGRVLINLTLQKCCLRIWILLV